MHVPSLHFDIPPKARWEPSQNVIILYSTKRLRLSGFPANLHTIFHPAESSKPTATNIQIPKTIKRFANESLCKSQVLTVHRRFPIARGPQPVM